MLTFFPSCSRSDDHEHPLRSWSHPLLPKRLHFPCRVRPLRSSRSTSLLLRSDLLLLYPSALTVPSPPQLWLLTRSCDLLSLLVSLSYVSSFSLSPRRSRTDASSLFLLEPQFSNQMYTKLGTVGAGCLLGGLMTLMAPLPFFFFRYGARIRAGSKYSDRS